MPTTPGNSGGNSAAIPGNSGPFSAIRVFCACPKRGEFGHSLPGQFPLKILKRGSRRKNPWTHNTWSNTSRIFTTLPWRGDEVLEFYHGTAGDADSGVFSWLTLVYAASNVIGEWVNRCLHGSHAALCQRKRKRMPWARTALHRHLQHLP